MWLEAKPPEHPTQIVQFQSFPFLLNMFYMFFKICSCALLESLGDTSPYEMRVSKFEQADTDGDGWITYEEFLPVCTSKQLLHIPKVFNTQCFSSDRLPLSPCRK